MNILMVVVVVVVVNRVSTAATVCGETLWR